MININLFLISLNKKLHKNTRLIWIINKKFKKVSYRKKNIRGIVVGAVVVVVAREVEVIVENNNKKRKKNKERKAIQEREKKYLIKKKKIILKTTKKRMQVVVILAVVLAVNKMKIEVRINKKAKKSWKKSISEKIREKNTHERKVEVVANKKRKDKNIKIKNIDEFNAILIFNIFMDNKLTWIKTKYNIKISFN